MRTPLLVPKALWALMIAAFIVGCGQAKQTPPSSADAREAAARSLLSKAAQAVASFHAKNRRVPTSLQEVVAARLLHIQKAADPWGQEFELVSNDQKPNTLEVCSSGPDTAPGTEDDLCKRITF